MTFLIGLLFFPFIGTIWCTGEYLQHTMKWNTNGIAILLFGYIVGIIILVYKSGYAC